MPRRALAGGQFFVGITPTSYSTRSVRFPIREDAPAPPPGPAAGFSPLVYNGGPIMRHANVFPVFWGDFTPNEIAPIRTYLTGLTAHISGAGAPAGQVPVIRQYGCRSAALDSTFFQDRHLPPFCPLMQPGATITALAPREGHVDLFATDASGTVWSTWWEAGPNWQPWFALA